MSSVSKYLLSLPLLILLFIIIQSTKIGYALSLRELLINNHIPEMSATVLTTYPHNKQSFTEGIELSGEYYYESSGLYKKSTLQKIELKTGKIINEYKLPGNYFAEGLTIINGKIYQLTYKEKIGFVYDQSTLKLLNTFSYSGQGWGLTNNGSQLIMSNGSSILSFLRLSDFKVDKTIKVHVAGNNISYINELEYINDKIYANVWYSTIILVISPDTGNVLSWFDIASLKPSTNCPPSQCVANGIFYDKKINTVYVTGKYWPYIYQLKLSNEL